MPNVGEETKISMNVKFFGSLLVIIALGIGGYYSMLADIKEAAGLPKPPISRVEFELKTNRYAELIKDLEDKYTEEKQKREELEQELKDFKETYYENR